MSKGKTSTPNSGAPSARSPFNQSQLEDIGLAEDIVASARLDRYKTARAAREITTAVVDALAALCLDAPRLTAEAVDDDTGGEARTLNASGHHPPAAARSHHRAAVAPAKAAHPPHRSSAITSPRRPAKATRPHPPKSLRPPAAAKAASLRDTPKHLVPKLHLGTHASAQLHCASRSLALGATRSRTSTASSFPSGTWERVRKGSFDAPPKRVDFVAEVVNPRTNAEWREHFLPLITAPYLIVDLDPAYRWTVVGHPSRDYGWIMAREKTMPAATYRAILRRLAAQGYDPRRFAKVPQLRSQLPGPKL